MKYLADDWVQIETDYCDVRGVPLRLNVLVDRDRLVLLDVGTATTPEASIRPELAAAGLRAEDIDLVVISHAHPDHQGGASGIRDMSHPRFAGPAEEVAWLESNERLMRDLLESDPDTHRLSDSARDGWLAMLGERVRLDALLRDGDVIELTDSSLQVVVTSGHSPGHIALFDANRRVLFSFDDVQGHGIPVANSDLMLPPIYHDVDRYRAGLARLRELDFELMVPSHMQPLKRDQALARIDDSLTFVEEVDELVRDHLASTDVVRLGPLAEAIGTRWPYGGLNIQTMTVAKAHLRLAVERGDASVAWHPTRRS